MGAVARDRIVDQMTKKSCRRGGDRVDILVCGRVGLGGIDLGFTAEQLLIPSTTKRCQSKLGRVRKSNGTRCQAVRQKARKIHA